MQVPLTVDGLSGAVFLNQWSVGMVRGLKRIGRPLIPYSHKGIPHFWTLHENIYGPARVRCM